MLQYSELKRNRRKLLALAGLTAQEFELLLPAFAQAYERRYPPDQTLAGKARKRKVGGGRVGSLPGIEQKLLFILVYQKTYPLQTVQAELFDLSQSRANGWIHYLLPALLEALDELGVLPERDPQQFAQSAKQAGQTPELIIDGTERRRQRPKNPEKQALHYSGKKKAHSDKNVVIVNAKSKRVDYLSQTYAGKIHDKKIADSEGIHYAPASTLHKDTGFQGYEPPVRQTYQPKKSRAAKN